MIDFLKGFGVWLLISLPLIILVEMLVRDHAFHGNLMFLAGVLTVILYGMIWKRN